MSRDARQSVQLILLVAGGVAVVTALAWWSVVGLVFVVLAALLGGVVGWTLGYRAGALERERSKPNPRQRTPARSNKGGKR